MRVLGIDPGLRNMGWGVIDVSGSKLSHVANGICHSETGMELAERLLTLHAQLTRVFETYRPQTAAVEHTFVNKDGVAIKSAKDFKVDASGNVEIKGSKVDLK